MKAADQTPGSGATIEKIPREECLALMARQPIGRIAVADPGAAPIVVPVNFLLDGDAVVFRTDPGSKFGLAVLDGRPVSFEVDGVDAGRHGGWSVLVRGTASEIASPDDDRPEGEATTLRPWAPGSKSHWVRIVPDVISGRRNPSRPKIAMVVDVVTSGKAPVPRYRVQRRPWEGPSALGLPARKPDDGCRR